MNVSDYALPDRPKKPIACNSLELENMTATIAAVAAKHGVDDETAKEIGKEVAFRYVGRFLTRPIFGGGFAVFPDGDARGTDDDPLVYTYTQPAQMIHLVLPGASDRDIALAVESSPRWMDES